MLAIVDYGVGNLYSLFSSFRFIGAQAQVTSDPQELMAADRIVLPGVGAFENAARRLEESGLKDLLLSHAALGKPLMGICLGMQLLFDKSLEYGEHEGMGLIPGVVRGLAQALPEGYKVPHIGWNALAFSRESALFEGVRAGECVYFVHSFAAMDCAPYVVATAQYALNVTAAVEKGNVCGTQFHPEKSGDVGLRILKNFLTL